MPPPLEITSRVLVPAAPQQVWDLAMDWSRQGDWMPGTRVRGGAGVGAEVVAWSGIGPAGFTDTMVITEWEPPHRFADVQLKGPYKLWHHEHRFTAEGSGTRISDEVQYALPFGPFGLIAHQLKVKKDVEAIFEYRKDVVAGLFGG